MRVSKYFAGALMVLSAIAFSGCSDKSGGFSRRRETY